MDTNKNHATKIILVLIAIFCGLFSLTLADVANAAIQSSASFAGADTVSQGNWQGKYGSDGYSIPNGPQSLPSYSWSPSPSSIGGYNVYVSTISGSSYVKLTANPVGATGYTDAGLQTPQTRYYVVTAVDSGNNESAFSSEVSAIIP